MKIKSKEERNLEHLAFVAANLHTQKGVNPKYRSAIPNHNKLWHGKCRRSIRYKRNVQLLLMPTNGLGYLIPNIKPYGILFLHLPHQDVSLTFFYQVLCALIYFLMREMSCSLRMVLQFPFPFLQHKQLS
jgi:hypothetical protein